MSIKTDPSFKKYNVFRVSKAYLIFRTVIDWGTTIDRKYLVFPKYTYIKIGIKIDFRYQFFTSGNGNSSKKGRYQYNIGCGHFAIDSESDGNSVQ